jgi:hypothetical protein
MAGRPQLAAAALGALALVFAGCGGGSKNAAEPLPTTPTLTVPGEKATPTVTRTTKTDTTATETGETTATTTAPTTTTQANPSTPQGGAAPPQTGGATPDTQQNDQAPEAGSPAQKFEEFCKDNPGAC